MWNGLLLLLPLTLLAPADDAVQAMAVDDLDDDDIEAMFEELVDQSEAVQRELQKISKMLGKILEERGGEQRKPARKQAVRKKSGKIQKVGVGACGDCSGQGTCGPKAKAGCGQQGKCDVRIQCGPRGQCGPGKGACQPCCPPGKVQIQRLGVGACGPKGKCGGDCSDCPKAKAGCGPRCQGACQPGKAQYKKIHPQVHKDLKILRSHAKPVGKGMIIIDQDGERRVEEFDMDGLQLGGGPEGCEIRGNVEAVDVDGDTAKIVLIINGERREIEVPIPQNLPMVDYTLEQGQAPIFGGEVPVLGELFKVEKAGCDESKSCNKKCDECPGPNFY